MKTTVKFIRLLILTSILFYSASTHCWAKVRIDSVLEYIGNGQSAELIGNSVYILEDPSGKMDIAEVISHNDFKRSESQIPNLGVSKSVFWIRVTIANPGGAMIDVENTLLNDVTLYSPLDSLRFEKQTISKDFPFETRVNGNKSYTFILKQISHPATTYYLKIKGNTQLLIPIRFGPPAEIYKEELNENLIAGFYLGIMMVMLLYNFFIWISIKDKSYLYYLLYLVSVTSVQLNITGFGFKYLWPDFPEFEKMGIFLFPSFTAFTSIAFFRQFVHTRQFTPGIHKLLWVFVAAYAFTLANAIWGNKLLSYNLININPMPVSFCMIGTAIYIWLRYKFRPALFFLISWSVFLGSIVIFVLKDFGVLPYNLFTVSSILIGSAIEVVLLSLALADRINTFKKEKEVLQAQALAAAQENEKIIREQNIILESKVAERTTELKASNSDLNTALINLKEAEAQMVESEKMASLGQLTAGIAHEINNPINFVASSVIPLIRDFDLLVDMVNKMERVSYAEMTLEDKRKYVEHCKTENDFDLLKTEIMDLLNGINEGASRTEEIVKGLRVFSSLDKDSMQVTNINEGVDSALALINYVVNENISVIKNYGNQAFAEAYPAKLNQVFINLITNAIYAINVSFWG